MLKHRGRHTLRSFKRFHRSDDRFNNRERAIAIGQYELRILGQD